MVTSSRSSLLMLSVFCVEPNLYWMLSLLLQFPISRLLTNPSDRPVTYLYNTLHYYERHLRDRTNLKRKLVHAIMSSLKDNRTPGWCLSETYLKFGMNPREDNVWVPDDTYYCKLIGRLVDNILPSVL